MRSLSRTALRAARAGFTLVELLAVILIISILMVFLLPKIPEAIDSARVVACKRNLSGIFEGLSIYQQKYERAPNESGVRFFAVLISRGVWENDESRAKTLTCPGVDMGSLAIGDIPPEEWFSDLEVIDGSYSSYAGRDCKNYPLRKFPGSAKIAIVADDNDGGMNHRTTTNVLYSSGNVKTFEIFELREQGIIGPDEDLLVVGPESPVEELQPLSLD